MALVVSFKNAPPASGSSTDIVPPGAYVLEVTKADLDNMSSSGKKMPVVNLKVVGGEYAGKRLRDQFVLQANDPAKIAFGLQRLHQFFLALGLKFPTDKAFKIEGRALQGKRCRAEVVDGEIPATDDRPPRKVSQIDSYVVPERAAAAVAEDDEDDEDDEETPEPVPVAVAPRARRNSQPAPPPEPEPEDLEEIGVDEGDEDDEGEGSGPFPF